MANALPGKFGRNYTLTVGTRNGGSVTIQPPLTLEFDITRNTLTSANVCQIRVYNLSQRNRDLIRQDQTNLGDRRPIFLQAGYGTILPLCFSGNMNVAWSVREGTNFITQMECYDGGFAFTNAFSSITIPAKTPNQDVIKTLSNQLIPYGVNPGLVGSFPGELKSDRSFVGPTIGQLGEFTGGGFFIDNSKANALANNEVFDNVVITINRQTGLLNTPTRQQSYVDLEMLFEPRLNIGDQVLLESVSETKEDPNYNGYYKVVAVKHRGMISGAVCGDAITTLKLIPGTPNLATVGTQT